MRAQAQFAAGKSAAPSRGTRRAQAAIEFLTTYGWAIVIMLSVMSVMFYLGFFSPTTVAPKACVFPSGFSCSGYRITGGGVLDLVLVQSTGHTLRLDRIACTEEDTPSEWNTTGFPKRVYNGESVEILTTCKKSGGGSLGIGEYYKGSIFIEYFNEDTNIAHSAIGEISYRVEEG